MTQALPLEFTVIRSGHSFPIVMEHALPTDVPSMKEVHRFGRIGGDASVTPVYAWARFTNQGYYENWGNNLFDGRKVVLKASLYGKVIGFVVGGAADTGPGYDPIAEKYPGLGELHQIYVVSGFQGSGIGTALYAELLREMKKQGYHNLVINLLSGNENATRFYESRGARLMEQVVETKLGEPGHDRIEIKCNLMVHPNI